MATIETYARRLDTAHDLQTLTRTMKAMAAVALRMFEQAVESVEEHERVVQQALQILLRQWSVAQAAPAGGPMGLVVVGSDIGLCGTFNQVVARQASQFAADQPHCLAVGNRLTAQLKQVGITAEDTLALPGSVPGLAAVVYDLVVRIEAWKVPRVVLLHNATQHGLGAVPVLRQLLPWSDAWLSELQERPWPERNLPVAFGSPDEVWMELVRQYLFATLYAALARSLAAENAARLMAMQQAERNIGKRIEALRREFNQMRQAAVMEELLDITSGFNALRPQGEPAHRMTLPAEG